MPTRGVRPTGERTREALFDVVGERVEGARVLDAFAGSGALGLEALSRGAREVTFCEPERAVLAVLRDNVHSLDAGERARIVPRSIEGWSGERFDLVLADPPWDRPRLLEAFERLAAGLLSADGLLVVERETRAEPIGPAGLSLERSRRYGRETLDFFVANPPRTAPAGDAPASV